MQFGLWNDCNDSKLPIAFTPVGLAGCHTTSATSNGRTTMKKWKSPRVCEICVGMEINSYACAEID